MSTNPVQTRRKSAPVSSSQLLLDMMGRGKSTERERGVYVVVVVVVARGPTDKSTTMNNFYWVKTLHGGGIGEWKGRQWGQISGGLAVSACGQAEPV